jgi:hypothetical protein
MGSGFGASGAQIPIELTGPTPRVTRLAASGVQLRVIAAIYLLMALAGAAWAVINGVQQTQRRTALRLNGRESQGQVTRISRSMVYYTFPVDGTYYLGNARAPRAQVKVLNTHDSLAVRYLPENPAVSHPAAWEWTVLLDGGFIYGPCVFVGLGAVFLISLGSDRKLAAEGAVAQGTVTGSSTGRRGGFIVKYEFRTEDGSVLNGIGASAELRQQGAAVWVLYLPARPGRNRPYPLMNWRVGRRL